MLSALKSVIAFLWRFVIYYIKGDQSGSLQLRDAELAEERARVKRLEAAAEGERAERLKVVDEKAAAVTDRAGADQLLRDVTGADDTDLN